MVSDAVKKMRREGRAYLARKPKAFGRGGSSRKVPPSVSLRPEQIKAISEGRDPQLSPSQRLAAEQGRITDPSIIGSRSSKSYSSKVLTKQKEATVLAKIRTAELKRVADARTFAEKSLVSRQIVMSRQGQKEFQRMLQFRSTLIKKGAKEDKRFSTNQAGENLVVSQWRVNGNRVEKIVNKDKGTTTYSTFKNGRKTGGVSMGSVQTVSEASGVKITKSSDPKKLIVTFPNGIKGTIKSTGRVVVGARLAGKKYEFQDGVLRKIDGVDIYEEKLKPVEVESLDKTFSLKRAKDLSAELTKQYSTTKNRLQKARDDGELEQLRELQSTKNRTSEQNKELDRLTKRTAENYRLGGNLAGLFLANMVVRMGIGTVEIVRLVKENPQAFFLALPGNIYEGAKQDFKIFTSGDPLAISELGAEYYTGSRVIKLAGKGFAVPVAIGKTLSPKYFSKIGTNILIPPATLRGALSKTAAGRRAVAIISAELKKKGVTAKVDAFIKKAKKFKGSGDVKIRKVKKITASVIKNLESRTNLDKQYKRAKQNFKMSMDKRKTVTVGNDDYVKAVVFIEGLSSNIAKLKSQNFIKNFKVKGGKIDKRREVEFIEAVQKDASKKLNSLPEFKELKNTARLKKSFQINLRKRGKIESAKITFKKLKVKVSNFPLVKKMNSVIKKLAAKGREIKRVVKKGVKRVEKGVKKFKSQIEIIKMKKAAAKFRKKSKWKQSYFGDNRYEQVKYAMEGSIKSKSFDDISKIIVKAKKDGIKIGLGKQEELVNLLVKHRMNILKKTREYKVLDELSKLNKPYMIEFRKKGKFESAKKLFNKTMNRVRALKTPTSAIRQRLRIKVRGIKGKFTKRARARKERKFVRQTIKYKQEKLARKRTLKQRVGKFLEYRMEKKIPLRKVSLDKLKRSQKVSEMNNFIDKFFNELNRRQTISLAPLKFSQMKNVIKKRMRNAINKGNLPEINNFRTAVTKLVIDMNKKSSNPDVKIIKTTGKDRRIRTIKDFESPAPKGTYREVKVGNQVMLQEVKQIQRTKQVTKQKQVQQMQQPKQVQQQEYKVVSVQKKNINLKPLLDFGVKSLSAVAIKNTLIGRQTFGIASNQGQLIKVLSGSAQDFKVLQSVGQGMNVNVASAVMSAVRSNSRVRSRLKTKQVMKKKKPVIFKLKTKPKNTHKLKNKVQTYGFVIKKAGKMVRLKIPPMTLKDAWDTGAYVLDHQLQRTGKLIPVGMNNVVAKLGKNVAGYYGKNSKKFRRARIKKGKVLSLERTIIEKNRYIRDMPSERRALARERKIAALKKPKTSKSKTKTNRKPTKIVIARKKVTTLNNLKSIKKSLLLKRKRMVNKLKKR